MKYLFLIASIAAVIIGGILRYWIGRRQYYRRHRAVQTAPSYERMLRTRLFENTITFLYYFLFIAGTLLLLGSLAVFGSGH